MDWVVSLPDRLDSFLSSEGRMLSRAKAQKAIDEGRVSVNDEVIKKPAFRIQEGDKVSLSEAGPHPSAPLGMTLKDLSLSILYEDDACLVIDKPAGIAVHPGAGMAPGEVTILNGIAYLFSDRGSNFSSESVLVHRLDKETTGCLLVAKTEEAHRVLQAQFEERSVKKLYLALVAGIPKHSTATVDAPIGRHVNQRTQMTIYHTAKTREAQTTYRVISTGEHAALLECDLHTGRTHQIRVHVSSIGHPVLGDLTYRSDVSERLTQEYEIRNLCLHAWKLTFTSPGDQKLHEVTAALPQEFQRSIESAGLNAPK